MDRLIDVTKLRLPCKGDYFKCIKGGAAKYDCFNCNREITASAQDAKTASLVAQEIFKELEEYFGLHETGCNGKDVLVKLTVREDIVMNYDNKSMNQLNIYQAIKSRWVKE